SLDPAHRRPGGPAGPGWNRYLPAPAASSSRDAALRSDRRVAGLIPIQLVLAAAGGNRHMTPRTRRLVVLIALAAMLLAVIVAPFF
ncbi:MAG: hypothetical protein Q4P32_11410, partial [Micrococcales bacterium]|nr:hypothetical protein [Micrococcales bacterium]